MKWLFAMNRFGRLMCAHAVGSYIGYTVVYIVYDAVCVLPDGDGARYMQDHEFLLTLPIAPALFVIYALLVAIFNAWLFPILAVVYGVPAYFSYEYLTRKHERYLAIRKGIYCVACGYDVRYSESECPECGAPIERAGHE